jgi:hypothetical protein
MKKVVLAVLSVVFAAANVFAFGTGEKGEVNVKLSYDLNTSIEVDSNYKYHNVWSDRVYNYEASASGGKNEGMGAESGLTIGGEYLYPLFSRLKVGGGLQYFLARKTQKNVIMGGESSPIDDFGKADVAYLPVYATIQVNPFAGAWYLKTNFGYSLYSKFKLSGGVNLDNFNSSLLDKHGFGQDSHKSGVYFGIITGWEIISSRVIIELGYESYSSKTEYSWNYYEENNPDDLKKGTITAKGMTRIYLALGYKIKL